MSMDSAHSKPASAPSMSMFANSADCATYWRARCEATDLIADGLDAQVAALLAALEQIADGCINRRPGHADIHKNLTKAEIEGIARAAIANPMGAKP